MSSREVIDLTASTPEKKRARPREAEVVVVEEVEPEVQVVGESRRAVAPPPPPVAAPRPPKRICHFGVRCRKMTDRQHLLDFAHHDVRTAAPLPTLRLPPNMFGGPAAHAEYLAHRQRQLEQEERALVKAVADSLQAAAEARERQQMREQQDAEYARGLQRDKKAAASVRQLSAETVVVEEEEQKVEKGKEEEDDEVAVAQQQPEKRSRTELLPEPAESESDVVAVTFQLPDGSRVTRRFRGGDSCAQLFALAEERCGEVSGELQLLQLPQTALRREALIRDYGTKRYALFVRIAE
jgi:hypothetical protein